ncbi:MAG: hypothetical protein JSV89_13405 [Spirochaetaceae bacterium]|nr:MAG: hypothetical protein JSV89_13405 [Spirochaetaceae bacterium]
MDNLEKVFPEDKLSKKERVLRTVNHQAVDRVAIHEQLSYNGQVIAHFTGKDIEGFEFTPDDVGLAIRKSLDTCFPIFENKGTGTLKTEDGFVMRNDHWTTWRVSRPFSEEVGAAEWLKEKIRWMSDTGFNDHTAVKVEADGFETTKAHFDGVRERKLYRKYLEDLQEKVGETVIIDFSFTGFCDLFDAMGLEIYTFFSLSYPELLKDYMEISIENELRRVHAVADIELSPLILIPEDFATKAGPIFGPAFLDQYHYPYVERLAAAWHEHGFTVLYHSDGNYKEAIPALIACGVDGFYCLEPSCGMDIIELKRQYPETIWAGGIDGVTLMERGTPEQVKEEVHRQIEESDALKQGGMLLATSSEINPTISLENYLAMIEAAGECRLDLNGEFSPNSA